MEIKYINNIWSGFRLSFARMYSSIVFKVKIAAHTFGGWQTKEDVESLMSVRGEKTRLLAYHINKLNTSHTIN